VRRVPARDRGRAGVSRVWLDPRRGTRSTRDGVTIRRAGRVTAGLIARSSSRKVRTPQGKDAGETQAAKADGKWNRKETAGRFRKRHWPVRVKRWGKSPPAAVATRSACQTPSGARRSGSG